MELTYENISKWFDSYFAACNKNQGPIETVVNLKRFFTDDFQFCMQTPPPFITGPLSREGLLMTFVHPGLQEDLRPNYYVIDTKNLIVVVQFELQFTEQATGKTWPALQASAHYHLLPDPESGLVIKMIKYWTQSSTDVITDLFDVWNACKERALEGLANDYFATHPSA